METVITLYLVLAVIVAIISAWRLQARQYQRKALEMRQKELELHSQVKPQQYQKTQSSKKPQTVWVTQLPLITPPKQPQAPSTNFSDRLAIPLKKSQTPPLTSQIFTPTPQSNQKEVLPQRIGEQMTQPLPDLKALRWTGVKQSHKPLNLKRQQELMALLHGDTAIAKRLLQQQQLHPGMSDNWYLEKVLDDLKRDRHY